MDIPGSNDYIVVFKADHFNVGHVDLVCASLLVEVVKLAERKDRNQKPDMDSDWSTYSGLRCFWLALLIFQMEHIRNRFETGPRNGTQNTDFGTGETAAACFVSKLSKTLTQRLLYLG